MKIVKTISEIRDIVKEWKKSGYSIGLVPTMGYLHAGHGSLIEQSVKNNDKTVVSVIQQLLKLKVFLKNYVV